MNKNILKLYQIAGKKERRIIGLMSGTSLDGLDMALCKFESSGLETTVQIEAFDTATFSEEIKQEIRKVFAKKQVDLQQLTLLNAWIGNLHGALINNFLLKNNIEKGDVDLIASHGQTIFHAPKRLHSNDGFPNATLQIGDGDHIAVKTGIITFSDFRQKHIAAGGEGAPLAVYGDYLLFSKKGEDRIMLNIGGTANFTYLAGDLNANKMFSTDVGPGNTLIDAFTRKHYPEKSYDQNGEIASKGKVNSELLAVLKELPFFDEEFPKTTGPELFSMAFVEEAQRKTNTLDLPSENLIATLTQFSAEGIADAVKRCFDKTSPVIYFSGGGMHNLFLRKALQILLPDCIFRDTSELGINPDAKEAVLFATLANESIAATEFTIKSELNGIPDVFMGKISFPE